MDYTESMAHVCRNHKVDACPTREWIAGRTVVTITHDGRLVHARVFALDEAAATQVRINDQRYDEQVAKYVNAGLKLPIQFTEAGKIRCTIWQGGAQPMHDAWGREVK